MRIGNKHITRNTDQLTSRSGGTMPIAQRAKGRDCNKFIKGRCDRGGTCFFNYSPSKKGMRDPSSKKGKGTPKA